MKIFSSFLCFAAIAFVTIEARERPANRTPSSHSHSNSHSCECEKEKFIYKCNNNEWLSYLLDEAPVEDGIYFGDYESGVPGFVGASKGDFLTSAGRLQLIPPRGVLDSYGVFSNNSNSIWYLKNDCHHQYSWIPSKNGEIVENAVEVYEENYNGFPAYVGRKVEEDRTFIGTAFPICSTMYYPDAAGNGRETREYEVLVCKSKVFETPKATTASPNQPSTQNPTTSTDGSGCVHEWKKYENDDEPASCGISAGLFDSGNQAYIGKVNDGKVWSPARIQINEPNSGAYVSSDGKVYFNSKDGYFLVDNPNYNYYWKDTYGTAVPSNAVALPTNGPNSWTWYVGRSQIDGQVRLGPIALPMGFYYPGDDGFEHYTKSYQTLVCDPKPAKICKQVWKPYKNDNKPASDGIDAGIYYNGNAAFVGRSDNKKIVGHDYVVGRVQTSNVSGVYTLNSVNGGVKFDPNYGEYLVKNSKDNYEWINTHSGDEVKNALKVPISYLGECCGGEFNHPGFAYIGRYHLDSYVNIGTVYQSQGLAYVDVNGVKKVVSSFEVLTCNSAENNDEPQIPDHCKCKCLDEEKFYFN